MLYNIVVKKKKLNMFLNKFVISALLTLQGGVVGEAWTALRAVAAAAGYKNKTLILSKKFLLFENAFDQDIDGQTSNKKEIL